MAMIPHFIHSRKNERKRRMRQITLRNPTRDLGVGWGCQHMLGIHRSSLTAAALDAVGCECGQGPMAILILGVVSWAGLVWG